VRKYRNIPVEVDGLKFPSKAQARRYGELKILLGAGKIRDLRHEVTFALYGKGGSPICRYRADFTYFENDKPVAEDVKGVATAVFGIKAKLFKDNYGDQWELRVVR
jgi:hypothetical protein